MPASRFIRTGAKTAVPALPRYGAQQLVRRIGILGGTFDPAHEGHRDISLAALKQLGLQQVWWLLTPQNRLKHQQPKPLAMRMQQAQQIANHPRIRVVAWEQHFGTTATVAVLRILRQRNPRSQIMWLMGADCLVNLDKWYQPVQLFAENSVAIFARPAYDINNKAMKHIYKSRSCAIQPREAYITKSHQSLSHIPPVWTIIRTTYNRQSSTALRRQAERHS